MTEPPLSQGGMAFEQAERRLQEIRSLREAGQMDEATYRLEVARLLLRDEQGTFWLLDAGSGQWLYNCGDGWHPGDPGGQAATAGAQDVANGRGRGRRRALAMAVSLVLVLAAAAAASALARWPAALWAGRGAPAPVSIASPAEGSRVALGQDVAVELTIHPGSGASAVAWVELQAGGVTVARRDLRLTGMRDPVFLTQVWRPQAVGEVSLAVLALAADGRQLGEALLRLHVIEAASVSPRGPECTPAATLLGDVTIHPGMAFPPGARMDKMWQVQNSGACAWGTGYELVFTAGQRLGAPGAVPVPVTPAQGSVALPVTFWAPAAGGTYTSTWQLRSPAGIVFGPLLTLDVRIEAQAVLGRAPFAPANVRAALNAGGPGVLLTWDDVSSDENGFRVYRRDILASIGLVPADAASFVDEQVACGQTYHYIVVSFNAAGSSPGPEADVALPDCPHLDRPPSLVLSVMPAQVGASGAFTLTFEAVDDGGVARVRVWGQDTGDAEIDAGRIITCGGPSCSGEWPLVWSGPAGVTVTLTAVAVDSAGQESQPVQVGVAIPPR